MPRAPDDDGDGSGTREHPGPAEAAEKLRASVKRTRRLRNKVAKATAAATAAREAALAPFVAARDACAGRVAALEDQEAALRAQLAATVAKIATERSSLVAATKAVGDAGARHDASQGPKAGQGVPIPQMRAHLKIFNIFYTRVPTPTSEGPSLPP